MFEPTVTLTTADTTMMGLLERQARERRDLPAYIFRGDDGSERSLTFGELSQRARAVASVLQGVAGVGDRALLIFPPGLDFIAALFGCIHAGVLAVPATFPKPNRPASRLAAIAADCEARMVLTTSPSLAALQKHRASPELAHLEWLAVDEIADEQAARWTSPALKGNDLVFLQYTSGSTDAPKGVMVSHSNLLHNLEAIRRGFALPQAAPGESAGTGVSWLPAYHDMGLIGGILESLYVGGRSVLFPPTSFLRKPARWLRAIGEYGASVSGAPNFAFELCVQKVSSREMEGLDLSSWEVAFCGAEPIAADTLERFAETFAPCGFRPDAFYCCYGLAEATLLASGGCGPSAPVIRGFRRRALSRGEAVPCGEQTHSDEQQLVGCGGRLLEQEIVIVDPETGQPVEPRRVGEIWLRGPHVSRGYWGREEENAATFAARFPGDEGGGYLRTGDLGFLLEGELYVAGRLKDVLIIRGRNHYPHDIEHTVTGAHPALTSGAGAALAVSVNGQECLVIVQEVDRHAATDVDAIFRSIRREVTAEHEVDVFAIVLIRRASLPRTTSGKVQRFLCREQYLSGTLKVVAAWTRHESGPPPAGTHSSSSSEAAEPEDSRPAQETRSWKLPALLPHHFEPGARQLTELEVDQLARRIEAALLEWLVRQGGVPEAELDPRRPFAEYGVDSLAAVELIQQLQDTLQVRLTAMMAWNYPTPAAMAAYLARRVGNPNADEPAEEMAADESTGFEALLREVESLDDRAAEAALERSNGRPPHPLLQGDGEDEREGSAPRAPIGPSALPAPDKPADG